MSDRPPPPSAPDDETHRLAPAGDAQLCLLVVGADGGDVHRLPERGEVIIGRSVESTIQIDEPSISRRHARIVIGDRVTIEDLGSANGVRVAQRLVGPDEPVEIQQGQAVELGSVVVVLHQPSMLPRVRGAGPAREERASLLPDGPPLVRAEAMKRLYAMIERIAPSELSVLLLGETGVGKEVVAEAIHRASARAAGPFVKINCAAIAESLVESELFGHERGAFTGAAQPKRGILEAADGGTIFLDEVGELSGSVQAKLLRVLEEREVQRVGSVEPRPIDVRFVSATNRDLKAESEAGDFRSDLYFRLNGISLEVPPLRERREEIVPLAQRFARRVSPREAPRITSETIALLERHEWPGNVRELRNAMERAAVLAGGGPILPEHLPPEVTGSSEAARAEGAGLRDEMLDLERRRILEALERCGGNQTKAAETLGMPRRTFVKRLDEYGIPRPRKGR